MTAPSTPPTNSRLVEGIDDAPRTSYMAKMLESKQKKGASPFDDLMMITRREVDFSVCALLGQGDFGKVYEVVEVRSGVRGCLKVVEGHSAEGDILCDLLRHSQSPTCMLRVLIDPWRDFDGASCLFMEMLAVGRLQPRSLEEGESRRVLRNLAEALAFLSRRRVVHNDVKLDNVGRREDGAAVLFDYGLAHPASREGHALGSREFLAPEMGVLPLEFFDRGDCYAMGLTLVKAARDVSASQHVRASCTGLLQRDFRRRLSAAGVLEA
jgi:serine/threonine protein kinase